VTLATTLGPLFSEWKALPSDKVGERAPAIRGRVDAALTAYVTGRLEESPRPAAPDIQDNLNRAIATATWESVFGLSRADVAAALRSNPPQPLAFVVEGSGPASDLYAVAFAIGFGNQFSTRVHGVGPKGEEYRAVNPTGTPVEGAVSDMVSLKPFASHELRFLLRCLHVGSPEALTTVAVYKFDGTAVQRLWMEQNLPAAKVTVEDGLVVIESHSHAFTKGGTVFNYERTSYHQTATGLQPQETTRWTER
jgi:hypothetical protein